MLKDSFKASQYNFVWPLFFIPVLSEIPETGFPGSYAIQRLCQEGINALLVFIPSLILTLLWPNSLFMIVPFSAFFPPQKYVSHLLFTSCPIDFVFPDLLIMSYTISKHKENDNIKRSLEFMLKYHNGSAEELLAVTKNWGLQSYSRLLVPLNGHDVPVTLVPKPLWKPCCL